MEATQRPLAAQIADAAGLDPGFKGWFTENENSTSHAIAIHFNFGQADQLDGVGRDNNGDFSVTGNYTEQEVFFVCRYGQRFMAPRKFTGSRSKDMSISGQWLVEEGFSQSGQFSIAYENTDFRSPPSYDAERLNLYYVMERIANGGFGIVSKVRRVTDGRVMVWKELNYARMNKKERRMMITEVNILRDIQHQHVVKYYDTIIVREQQKIYIVIEFCAKGDAGAMIDMCKRRKQRLEEKFIWKVLLQILLALQSCHNRDEIILHRDLKPANILLDEDGEVKIADFGLAAVVNSNSLASSKVGTPLYMAPEQVRGAGYTAKSDVWSLGCIIYEMAALKPPFDANNQMELAKCIWEGKFARIPDVYSRDLHRVICWMLQLSQENRPTVDELLRHVQRLNVLAQPPPAPWNPPAEGSVAGLPANPPPGTGRGGAAIEWLAGVRAVQGPDGVYRVEEVDGNSAVGRNGAVVVGDELRALEGREVKGMSPEVLWDCVQGKGPEREGSAPQIEMQVVKRSPSSVSVRTLNIPLQLNGGLGQARYPGKPPQQQQQQQQQQQPGPTYRTEQGDHLVAFSPRMEGGQLDQDGQHLGHRGDPVGPRTPGRAVAGADDPAHVISPRLNSHVHGEPKALLAGPGAASRMAALQEAERRHPSPIRGDAQAQAPGVPLQHYHQHPHNPQHDPHHRRYAPPDDPAQPPPAALHPQHARQPLHPQQETSPTDAGRGERRGHGGQHAPQPQADRAGGESVPHSAHAPHRLAPQSQMLNAVQDGPAGAGMRAPPHNVVPPLHGHLFGHEPQQQYHHPQQAYGGDPHRQPVHSHHHPREREEGGSISVPKAGGISAPQPGSISVPKQGSVSVPKAPPRTPEEANHNHGGRGVVGESEMEWKGRAERAERELLALREQHAQLQRHCSSLLTALRLKDSELAKGREREQALQSVLEDRGRDLGVHNYEDMAGAYAGDAPSSSDHRGAPHVAGMVDVAQHGRALEHRTHAAPDPHPAYAGHVNAGAYAAELGMPGHGHAHALAQYAQPVSYHNGSTDANGQPRPPPPAPPGSPVPAM